MQPFLLLLTEEHHSSEVDVVTYRWAVGSEGAGPVPVPHPVLTLHCLHRQTPQRLLRPSHKTNTKTLRCTFQQPTCIPLQLICVTFVTQTLLIKASRRAESDREEGGGTKKKEKKGRTVFPLMVTDKMKYR